MSENMRALNKYKVKEDKSRCIYIYAYYAVMAAFWRTFKKSVLSTNFNVFVILYDRPSKTHSH